MRNKEIKVGDQVWLYAPYMSKMKSGYTCDYSLIEEESITADRDHKLKAAGEALLNLSNFFKK